MKYIIAAIALAFTISVSANSLTRVQDPNKKETKITKVTDDKSKKNVKKVKVTKKECTDMKDCKDKKDGKGCSKDKMKKDCENKQKEEPTK